MKPSRLSAVNIGVLLLIFSLVTITACQKENSDNNNPTQEEEASRAASEGDGEAENIFNGIFDDAMGVDNEVGVSGSGVFFGRDSLISVPRCFTVTILRPTANPFPVRVIVDFGTTGCIGPDGRTRKGKVITEYTNRLIIPGAMATTTFDGYYVDDVKVEGTHKITNTSEPPTVLRRFRTEVINGKLTKPNGNFVEWNSTKVIVQTEGLLTPEIPRDDAFRIEGSARGRAKRGALIVIWESTITDPLIRKFICRHIVKGRIRTVRANVTSQSPWVAVLDFGTGNCDNQATLTVNGVSRQITLP